MDVGIKETIIAVVTVNKDVVLGEGVPIFYARDEKEREKISLLISKITLGMVHDLENGSYVIVRH